MGQTYAWTTLLMPPKYPDGQFDLEGQTRATVDLPTPCMVWPWFGTWSSNQAPFWVKFLTLTGDLMWRVLFSWLITCQVRVSRFCVSSCSSFPSASPPTAARFADSMWASHPLLATLCASPDPVPTPSLQALCAPPPSSAHTKIVCMPRRLAPESVCPIAQCAYADPVESLWHIKPREYSLSKQCQDTCQRMHQNIRQETSEMPETKQSNNTSEIM